MKIHDIFGPGSNIKERIMTDYEALAQKVGYMRGLGLRLGLTSGSFDMIHIGHARYVEALKAEGLVDVMIVGVESDDKVRERKKHKGGVRPVYPLEERAEMLCHLRHVDLVMVKELTDQPWQLIKVVRPDVLLVTQETYKDEQLEKLREFCNDIKVLAPQATTTTSAKIRRLFTGWNQDMREKIMTALEGVFRDSAAS
ncbi:MAG: adenylyltransferase/cytidyltransferase family protein [Candidatus Yanofskybacteria bacterium]|nr:adenylyltransferase/cytidyltransferase family protein [Candidatus Yanofskybacteria bacterium]